MPVTNRSPVSRLHQIGDDERYLKQNCPVRSWKSDYSRTSASIESTNLHNKNTWHLLPDANCQSEHRPLQEQLQVCTKRDSYGRIFQLLLQFKPRLYLQAINVTMISTFDYKEGKKTNIILQESNNLAKLIFKTSMMVLYGCWFQLHHFLPAIYGAIVHQMLWPLLTDNLYQGFLKFVLVHHYIKFNNFSVPSIILFCI